MWTQKYFLKNLILFAHKNLKKHPKKLWQLGVFFFSAAPPAQTSPELHFRFINFSIQPSLLESLLKTNVLYFDSPTLKSKIRIFDCMLKCDLCMSFVRFFFSNLIKKFWVILRLSHVWTLLFYKQFFLPIR